MNHTCKHCETKIPNGQAVIRSVAFERVAFHKDCWEAVSPAPRLALVAS